MYIEDEIDEKNLLMSSDEKIIEYGHSIGCQNLTVDMLINSHKALRESSMRSRQEINLEAEERAKRLAKYLLEANYISKKELGTLTLREIANIFSDE